MKKLFSTIKGSVPFSQIITWAVPISIAFTGILWGQIASSKADIDKVEAAQTATIERVATLEEAVSTIKTDTAEIKRDIKTLLVNSIKNESISTIKNQ